MAATFLLHQVGSFLVLLNAMRLLAFGGWAELPPLRWLRAIGQRIGRLDESLDLETIWLWLTRRKRRLLSWAVVLLAAVYASSGITAIGPGEVGLVQRFGGYLGLLDPDFISASPNRLRSVFASSPAASAASQLDFAASLARRASRCAGNPVTVEELLARRRGSRRCLDLDGRRAVPGDFCLGPVRDRHQPAHVATTGYTLGVADPEPALQVLAESAVRQTVASRSLLDVLMSVAKMLKPPRHENSRP